MGALQILIADDHDMIRRGLKALLDAKFANGRTLKVKATSNDGKTKEFEAKVRIGTPQEILYYENGGILQYVLRGLAAKN